MLNVVNGNRYLQVDDDIPCFDEDDSLEDDIVDAPTSKQPCLEKENEDVDSDVDKERVVTCKVTHTAARHAVQVLQQYFLKQGISNAHNTVLDMCADEVDRKAALQIRETTLDSFFQ